MFITGNRYRVLHLPMNQILVLLIVIFLSFHVNSQAISNSESAVLKPLHPSLALVLGIIALMLSVTFLILAYAKFCNRNSAHTNDRNFPALVRSGSRFSGIDRTAIDSLPFFRFSSLKGSKEGLECSVCLSRFEDTEILRLLPKCKHAFHINCIDQWLESHSSCPLCRYKFDPKDLKSFHYTNSFRYLNNLSNLSTDPNLEIFVQREQDDQNSSIFSSFRGNGRCKKQELLIRDGLNQKFLHKLKHKIIVSDVVIKNRWSDVNSSDLLFLNSEMLGAMASNRFSPSNSRSARLIPELSMNENIEKIKEDIERKRLYESKISRNETNESFSNFASTSSKMIINPEEKRSMSEITVCSRFKELSVKNRNKESALSPKSRGKEDRMRRLWLPIARRTIQWSAGSETNLSLKDVDNTTATSNV